MLGSSVSISFTKSKSLKAKESHRSLYKRTFFLFLQQLPIELYILNKNKRQMSKHFLVNIYLESFTWGQRQSTSGLLLSITELGTTYQIYSATGPDGPTLIVSNCVEPSSAQGGTFATTFRVQNNTTGAITTKGDFPSDFNMTFIMAPLMVVASGTPNTLQYSQFVQVGGSGSLATSFTFRAECIWVTDDISGVYESLKESKEDELEELKEDVKEYEDEQQQIRTDRELFFNFNPAAYFFGSSPDISKLSPNDPEDINRVSLDEMQRLDNELNSANAHPNQSQQRFRHDNYIKNMFQIGPKGVNARFPTINDLIKDNPQALQESYELREKGLNDNQRFEVLFNKYYRQSFENELFNNPEYAKKLDTYQFYKEAFGALPLPGIVQYDIGTGFLATDHIKHGKPYFEAAYDLTFPENFDFFSKEYNIEHQDDSSAPPFTKADLNKYLKR